MFGLHVLLLTIENVIIMANIPVIAAIKNCNFLTEIILDTRVPVKSLMRKNFLAQLIKNTILKLISYLKCWPQHNIAE